jgi:hypothetical protein
MMATDGFSEEPEGTRPHQGRQRGHSTCHMLSIGPPPSLNFANLSAKKTLQPTRDQVRPTLSGQTIDGGPYFGSLLDAGIKGLSTLRCKSTSVDQ